VAEQVGLKQGAQKHGRPFFDQVAAFVQGN